MICTKWQVGSYLHVPLRPVVIGVSGSWSTSHFTLEKSILVRVDSLTATYKLVFALSEKATK